jgi:hypothetical protein
VRGRFNELSLSMGSNRRNAPCTLLEFVTQS